MFKINEIKTISLKWLFAIGALLGAVFFIAIYGIRILDFTNTGWLFYGDNDLRQHYIAWCHYRSDAWHFPIGLIDSLSYPNSMSVIYTDSIPIFAVVFKLFASFLPVSFQYFGLFGLLSFMLMGGLSAVLLARFISDPIICVFGSVFFIISFQVIHRLYYHTALAAQWIIILAMILWVYDSLIADTKLKCLFWAVLSFLCVGIHSYFLPMVGMILLALMVQQYILKYETTKDVKSSLMLPLMEFMSFCIAGIFNLWILGGFYGGTDASGSGLGTFSSNLNTFINPLSYGKLMKELPMFFDFQYEGFGYLGCGILFLFFSTAVGMIFRMVRKVPEEAFHQNKIYGRVTGLVVLCSILSAVCPIITFNDKEIIHVPYPGFVEKILGVFRSNGRLIWVAVYVLMTAAICFSAYTFRHYRAVAVMIIAAGLVLQIVDQSEVFSEKHKYFTADYQIHTLWEHPELSNLAEDKDEFIFLYTNNDITLYSAYYGYLNGIRQNNYYFARDIDANTITEINHYMDELKNGQVRDDAVYIITDEMYRNDSKMYNNLPVRLVMNDGHVFFTK